MRIYKFLITTEYHYTHRLAIPVNRRAVFLDTQGMEHPDCPCVIISENRVMLPNRVIWNLGGVLSQWMYQDELRKLLPEYAESIGRIVVLMVWRNPRGSNPNSII